MKKSDGEGLRWIPPLRQPGLRQREVQHRQSMYLNCHCMPHDYGEALCCYRLAAENGATPARISTISGV